MCTRVTILSAFLVGFALLNSIEAQPSPDDNVATASVPKAASGEVQKPEKDSASLSESTEKAIDEIANAVASFVISAAEELEDAVTEQIVDVVASLVADVVISAVESLEAEVTDQLVDEVVEYIAAAAKSVAKAVQDLTDSEEKRISEVTSFLEDLAGSLESVLSPGSIKAISGPKGKPIGIVPTIPGSTPSPGTHTESQEGLVPPGSIKATSGPKVKPIRILPAPQETTPGGSATYPESIENRRFG